MNRLFASTIIAASAFMGLGFMASEASAMTSTITVDGVDYPICSEEDCSDQVGQVGVWQNDGRSWLELGEDQPAILIQP